MMRAFIRRTFAWFGYTIGKTGGGFWSHDEPFVTLYKESIRTHPEKKGHRMYMLYQCALAARVLQGDVAEVGVYRGDSAKMLAEVFKETGKKILLFDTFAGLPGETSHLSSDDFSDTSLEGVSDYLKAYKHAIVFHPGFFPDTAKAVSGTYCLVYLDADLSQSIQDGLEFFYTKMVPGGFIVVDDYRSKYWPAVTKVVDEFLEKVGNHALVSAPNQCIIIART